MWSSQGAWHRGVTTWFLPEVRSLILDGLCLAVVILGLLKRAGLLWREVRSQLRCQAQMSCPLHGPWLSAQDGNSPIPTSWHLKKGEISRVARMSFSRSR